MTPSSGEIKITWKEGPVYPALIKGCVAGIVEGKLLVTAGMSYPWREVEYGFWMPVDDAPQSRAMPTVVGEKVEAAVGQWRPLPPMPAGPGWTSGTAVAGGLVTVGGRRRADDGDGFVNITEVWFLDVAAGATAWRRLPDRPSAASISTSVADGDVLYSAFGSRWRPQPEHAAEDVNIYRLDVRADQAWRTVTRFPGKPRWGCAMMVCGGKLYVVGGHDVPLGGVTQTVPHNAYQRAEGQVRLEAFREMWEYDLSADTWRELDHPPRAFVATGFAVADRWLVLTGGVSWIVDSFGANVMIQNYVPRLDFVSFSREVWAYDTLCGRWRVLDPLPYGVCTNGLAADGQRVFLVGNETMDKVRSNAYGTVFEGAIGVEEGTGG